MHQGRIEFWKNISTALKNFDIRKEGLELKNDRGNTNPEREITTRFEDTQARYDNRRRFKLPIPPPMPKNYR